MSELQELSQVLSRFFFFFYFLRQLDLNKTGGKGFLLAEVDGANSLLSVGINYEGHLDSMARAGVWVPGLGLCLSGD